MTVCLFTTSGVRDTIVSAFQDGICGDHFGKVMSELFGRYLHGFLMPELVENDTSFVFVADFRR